MRKSVGEEMKGEKERGKEEEKREEEWRREEKRGEEEERLECVGGGISVSQMSFKNTLKWRCVMKPSAQLPGWSY